MSDYEQPEECESCAWVTTELRQYPLMERSWSLCEVCANSFAGIAAMHPRSYREVAPVLKMQAWTTNYLASLIRAGNE